MIFWIFATIIGLIMAMAIIWAIMDADGGIFGAGVVFSVAIMLVFFGCSALITHQDHISSTQQLQAINTGSATSGHFFLGTGGIGSNAIFYAYTHEGNSSKLIQVDASDATVVESNTTPHVTYGCSPRDSDKWWSGPIHNWFNDSHECDASHNDTVTFYVPPGSITNNINLKLPR